MNTIEIIYKHFIECNQKICTDTRKIVPDSIFFALKGANFDGNLFAIDALNKGCAYAVVDNPDIAKQNKQCILVNNVLHTLQKLANYHRKKLNIPVIGIAGSNGKTTTKELVSAVLSKKFKVLSTPGNFNNHIGLPLTLLQLTTEHQIAVIEMGANHPGEIMELCEIAEPDYAIITSIGKEHLEGFGDIETVKKTNGELYDYVLKKNGKIFLDIGNADLLSILNKGIPEVFKDDRFIRYADADKLIIAAATLPPNLFTNNSIILGKYLDNYQDIFVHFQWIKWELSHQDNIQFNIATIEENFKKQEIVKTHLLAYHNFINALCAVAVGNYFEVNSKDINDAIASYIPDKNRMQWLESKQNNKIILDAYNANPTSMMAALELFKDKNISDTSGKTLILGDMFELGEYAEKEHTEIVKWINNHFTDADIYLIGKEFTNAAQKIPVHQNIQTFLATDDFIKYLSSHKIENKFILIKASRGMRLEKTLDYL